jgi:hypothetical protein
MLADHWTQRAGSVYGRGHPDHLMLRAAFKLRLRQIEGRSRLACATETPLSHTSRTASNLNSRLNSRRPICTLRSRETP